MLLTGETVRRLCLPKHIFSSRLLEVAETFSHAARRDGRSGSAAAGADLVVVACSEAESPRPREISCKISSRSSSQISRLERTLPRVDARVCGERIGRRFI